MYGRQKRCFDFNFVLLCVYAIKLVLVFGIDGVFCDEMI